MTAVGVVASLFWKSNLVAWGEGENRLGLFMSNIQYCASFARHTGAWAGQVLASSGGGNVQKYIVVASSTQAAAKRSRYGGFRDV